MTWWKALAKKHHEQYLLEECRVRRNQQWLPKIIKTGLLLIAGMSMSACAGLFDFGGESWREQVLLHDGSTIIVERSQVREGRHEIGQGPPIKEHSITFKPPGASKPVTWKSEFTEDIGHSNFELLTLDIVNGTPYIATGPTGCIAYNKWDRPNPPYIFFRYAGLQWKKIPLQEFPVEIVRTNVVIDTYHINSIKEEERNSGFVSIESTKKLNYDLKQEKYKTILRKPINPDGREGCPVMVRFEGGWASPGIVELRRKMRGQ